MKTWKIICAAILLPCLLLIGGIQYRVSFAKTEIITSAANNEPYTLTIYQIGEPDWPFGPTHCRFDLRNGSKRIIKHPFSIRNDGCSAHASNFTIVWSADSAAITVSGEEQPDQTYILCYDGTVK